MAREISGLAGLAPAVNRQLLVVYGNRNWRTQVTGSTEAFLQVRGYQVASGRSFAPGEVSGGGGDGVVTDGKTGEESQQFSFIGR